MMFMDVSDEILKEINYVQISTYRTKVLKAIGDEVKIPSKIAKDSDIMQNHISNVLKQLREHELVECINPEVKKRRLYRLTEKGNELFKNLD